MPRFTCPTCSAIVDVADPYRFLCPRCGYRNYYTAPPTPAAPVPRAYAPPSSWPTPGQGQMPSQYAPSPFLQRTTPGSAVLSLIFGIAGACVWLVPLVGAFVALASSIVAILAGGLAIRRHHAKPTEIGGRGLAVAGIVLGVIGLLLSVYAFLIFQEILDLLREASEPPRSTR